MIEYTYLTKKNKYNDRKDFFFVFLMIFQVINLEKKE